MCCRDMLHREKNPSSECPERLPEQSYLFWLLNQKLVLSSQMSGPSPSWDSASHRLSTGPSRLPGRAPVRCADLIRPTVLLCLRGPLPGAMPLPHSSQPCSSEFWSWRDSEVEGREHRGGSWHWRSLDREYNPTVCTLSWCSRSDQENQTSSFLCHRREPRWVDLGESGLWWLKV